MMQEIQQMDLMDISPNWFYQKFTWNSISRLANVISWQGLIKKGDEGTIAEHAISICVAVPESNQMMTGPLFANSFLANVADYLVQTKMYDRLYVNGDAIMRRTDEKGEDGNPKDTPISFSFYKYINGISFMYFGFPNYSSAGGGIGMSKKQIEDFTKFCENLSIGILQTAFVNGLFASIGEES